VIDAIEALLETKKSIEKLSFNEPPTVKKAVSRIKHEDAVITYQSVQFT